MNDDKFLEAMEALMNSIDSIHAAREAERIGYVYTEGDLTNKIATGKRSLILNRLKQQVATLEESINYSVDASKKKKVLNWTQGDFSKGCRDYGEYLISEYSGIKLSIEKLRHNVVYPDGGAACIYRWYVGESPSSSSDFGISDSLTKAKLEAGKAAKYAATRKVTQWTK